MLHLFSTTSSTDWKGRPSHRLELLATGTREELLAKMDADVQQWQREALDEDRRQIQDNIDAGDAQPEDLPAPDAPWEIEGERWEMLAHESAADKKPTYPQTLREFAWNCNGEFSSVVYHLLDI